MALLEQNTDTYTLLEQLPGGPSAINTDTTSYTYFKVIYNTALMLTVALAILMIVVGGVQYTISWASSSAKGEAKTRIFSAIGGLVLALLSYLILQTINPALVTPSFIPDATVK